MLPLHRLGSFCTLSHSPCRATCPAVWSPFARVTSDINPLCTRVVQPPAASGSCGFGHQSSTHHETPTFPKLWPPRAGSVDQRQAAAAFSVRGAPTVAGCGWRLPGAALPSCFRRCCESAITRNDHRWRHLACASRRRCAPSHSRPQSCDDVLVPIGYGAASTRS